jgi:hypothetical protein
MERNSNPVALEEWAYRRGVKLDFILPGKPVENAFIDSFNGRFRDECLNVHQFTSPAEAQVITEAWRWSSADSWIGPREESLVHVGPVPRPTPWFPCLNEDSVDSSLAQIRRCVNRGTPFGSVEWVARVAVRLGLEASMRPLGRPRKPEVV